ALRHSERRFRKLFEGDLMGVFITRPDGTFLDCNDALVKMLGYDSREEVLRHRSLDFYVDPEFRQEAVRMLQEEGIYLGKEGRVWRKDGSIAHLLGAAVLLKDEETGEPYVQGIAVDITERRRAEDALRDGEERYRKLFESNLAGVYVTKLDGTILDFNDAMMKMLGYDSREEVFQHKSTDFYADPEFRKELIYLLHRDGVVPGKEALLQRKDGAPLYAIGAGALLTNERTGERYIQGVAVDITDRRRAEEALRELNNHLEEEVQARTEELSNTVDQLQDEAARRMLAEGQVREHSEMLEDRTRQLQRLMLELTQAEDRERKRVAEILHDDLQQVLAAAKFHLGLLDKGARGPEESRQITGQVKQMLKDAIEKSRSLSHELSPAVLYQSDLDDTFTWLARQIHDKYGLAVHLDIRGPVALQSEPLRALLYKATQELLFNVVKHARANEAWIRLRRLGGYICLSVSDKGRGFDPEQLREVVGFGLLSIRERVGLLGGRMKIKSTKGKGSTFHIVLPCRELAAKGMEIGQPPEDRAEAEGQAQGEGDGRLRVLLVDDHEIVRQGMASLLSEQPNIEIVGQASNGREAINLTFELRPNVVIMDVSMPLMNGDEATRQIKRHVPATRVVALSMYDEVETIERMHEAGAESYVLKTAPSEELLAAIRGKQSSG
ncbi:MAG: PAS domain S-box protein, partial [Planctomycetaceae bacterium]